MLESLIADEYSGDAIRRITKHLEVCGTFAFTQLPSGLYAASGAEGAEGGRYAHVWVRDNVYIAYALFCAGRIEESVRCARGLAHHFEREAGRFDACIEGKVDRNDPMERPHVRFEGLSGAELPEVWPHAQNDTHGLFLWLIAALVHARVLPLDERVKGVVVRTIRFLEALPFYEDADVGCWEEASAIRASSIGCVCAGLRAWIPLAQSLDSDLGLRLRALYRSGRTALDAILPYEVRDGAGRRLCDAALLTLISPLGEVVGAQAEAIISNVCSTLVGERGIARYVGDTFWGPDYDAVPVDFRTVYVGENRAYRATAPARRCEAEWCLFDPLLALHYASLFELTHERSALSKASKHLTRTLRALVSDSTGVPHLPELYYLRQGVRTPNPILPLVWADATLLLALTRLAGIV